MGNLGFARALSMTALGGFGLLSGVSAGAQDALVFVGRAPDLEGRPATAVFSINEDGSGRRQITKMTGGYAGISNRIQSPSVSPLGRKLAYFRWPRIHVCDWDGSNDVCVTPVTREHFQPAWSPDGKEIAFATDRTDDAEVFLMNFDGSNPRNISGRGLTTEMSPAWSPDGKEIAFISSRDGRFDIFVMDRFGRNQRAVTKGAFDCHYPAWSPDGKSIAFSGDKGGTYHLFMINPDGTGMVQLTDGDSWNGQPAWSQDGTRLAFTSTRDGGGSDIFVMDIKSRGIRNLTRTPGENESFPCWVPRQISEKPLGIATITPDKKTSSPFIQSLVATGTVITAADLSGVVFPRPRMLFRAEDLPALREKLGKEPYTAAWQDFLKSCEPLLDPAKPLLPTHLPKIAENLSAAQHPLGMAFNLGFAYQVTGNKKYGEAGARLLAETCTLLREYHPKLALDWPTGPAEYLPCAFDWLHDAMNEEQRRVVRAVLLNSTERQYRAAQQSAVGFSQIAENGASVGNITAIIAGYQGMGALALAGEPGGEPAWLDSAVHMLQRVVETWYDENGSPACGHSYFNWAGDMAIPFLMSCVRNNLGDNIAGQNIKKWPTWMGMTARDGLTRTINMGDAYAGPPIFNVAYLELYRNNPLVDLLWEKSGGAAAPKPKVTDLLWWRPVKANPKAAEALPRSIFFPKGGYMVFRSGFGADDPMLTFSASRYGGHSHAEGGAFCLYGYGMEFAVEAGNGNAAPDAHNNVLINGLGRANPWKTPDQDLIRPLPSTPLGGAATADYGGTLATRFDGHGPYAYPSPWYPVRKAIRHVAMIHDPKSPIPPYFLIADDIECDGKSNRYEFLLTGQRDNLLVTGDHQVVMRPIYRSPWFESGKPDKDDAVAFEADVPAAGDYRVWLYVKGTKGQYRIECADKSILGGASTEPSRDNCWQWQPVKSGERGKETPLTLTLPKGNTKLALRFVNVQYGGDFARMLLTPAADYEPWAPDGEKLPPSSILLKAEDAKAVGKAWIRHEAASPDTEPRALFAFLDSKPLSFEQSIYQYRTRHFGNALNRLPRVSAVREAVNPRFLVLAYPHRANMEQPKIERRAEGDTLFAAVTWKQATDTITWSKDAAPQVVRKHSDGTVIKLQNQ